MPERTPAQKHRRAERDKVRRAAKKLTAEYMDKLTAEIGIHWFVVGKSDITPCKKCGLLLAHKIHRDSVNV